MWKLIIILTLFVMCHAQSEDDHNLSRKHKYPFHHHHGLYHRGLYHYWIFLAIKAKIIFLIGTFISFWVFAGKAFAFLYYTTSKKESTCKCPEYHEKVVISDEAPYHQKFSKFFNSGPPPDYYFPESPKFEQRYSTIFKPKPLNTQSYSSVDDSYLPKYNKFARSLDNSIVKHMDILNLIFAKFDLTEYVFEEMNLKKKDCKMRFVCEAEYFSRNNSALTFATHFFSDAGLIKYQSNVNSTNLKECKSLAPDCDAN